MKRPKPWPDPSWANELVAVMEKMDEITDECIKNRWVIEPLPLFIPEIRHLWIANHSQEDLEC